MMFTTPMTRLLAVVLAKDSRPVTESLLREGVMQFISVSEFEAEGPEALSAVEPEVSLMEISEMRKRVEGFLHVVGMVPPSPKQTDLTGRVAVDVEKEKKRLDRIDGERESMRERQRALQQEVMKIEEIRRQVQCYSPGLSGVTVSSGQSMLSMRMGKLPVSNQKQLEDGLKGLPALSVAMGLDGHTAHHLLISMKRDSEQIDRVLASAGWTQVEWSHEFLSDKTDMVEGLNAKIRAITDEQKKVQTQVDDLVKKEQGRLQDLWVNLRVNELCYKIQACFRSSSRTIVFAGWLPSSKKESLITGITAACEGRCYLEWHDAESRDAIGDEIPIVFSNPKILAPFQMLVSNFGIPKYGTIDPTPFVMPLYLAMFGLMFADVGQGMVLALLGLLGVFVFGKKEEKKGLVQLSWLVSWCGLSSILFGVLLGSYFGMRLIEPLWFDFHGIVSGQAEGRGAINSVYDILTITLYFGMTVISLGLLFNWINLARTREWMELVYDKGGILGGWIYAGGIYVASQMVAHQYRELSPRMTLFWLVGLPSLLLLTKKPCLYFKQDRGHSDHSRNFVVALLVGLMEWIVELLEIFSGYLSNTLSFMRVAGLGIAHVCLMISIFKLANMTSGPGSVFILVVGNVLVIGLEGLSAGIQALRLNYYEFFTKFFHGTGKLHAPISLNCKL